MTQIKSQMFIAKNLYQMSQLVVAGDVIASKAFSTCPERPPPYLSCVLAC